jgi:hypothetical protein
VLHRHVGFVGAVHAGHAHELVAAGAVAAKVEELRVE